MRASDVARLSQPFPEGADPAFAAASALGVAVPRWDELESAILGDLRGQPPYGVSWWAPHPGTSRRILISDQLYACAYSASDNLIEAALHWLEFLDFSERYSDRFANVLSFRNGEPVITSPRPQSPMQQLGLQTMRLHVGGVVRALSSALDCLAASVDS